MFSELVKRARAGEVEAVEEIIKRLQPLLIASIRRYYNKPEEYEDLMQDGNMKIIQSINTFDEGKGVHFLGYIKMNIRFLYLDKHKERIHQSLNERVGEGEVEIVDLLEGEEVDFLGSLMEGERHEELRRALGSLTRRQGEVVELFYGRGLAIGEIANSLGISYRTVVNTKTRALEKMRKWLST